MELWDAKRKVLHWKCIYVQNILASITVVDKNENLQNLYILIVYKDE